MVYKTVGSEGKGFGSRRWDPTDHAGTRDLLPIKRFDVESSRVRPDAEV